MGILAMIIIGLVAGLIARALVPGDNAMGFVGTTLLGIAGSFVGGLLGSLFSSDGRVADFHPSGLIASVIGAILVLSLVHLASRRRLRV